MTTRFIFLAGMMLAMTPVAPAFAATTADVPVKPLRTLTWNLTMAVGTMRRIQTSGLRSDSSSGMSGGTGSGNTGSGASAESKGTITVDVIAVAAEGLVVDIAENASGRGRPKVRVAITNAGILSFDPKEAANVSEEETVLLRTLARGFLVETPAPGVSWNVDDSGNGVTAVEHYSVKSKTNDEVSLDYKVESSAKGANAFSATRLGSIVYDAKYVMPLKLAYQEIVSQDRIGQSDRTTTSVDLKLASDTFKKN